MWALHPDAVGKGFVESTTRYRKTAPLKRAVSRVQTAAATKSAIRRTSRKSSAKSVSASPRQGRQPTLTPMAAPIPQRPASYPTLALEDAAMPWSQDMLPSYSQSSASTEYEGNVSGTDYDDEFHTGLATPGPSFDGQSAPAQAAAQEESANVPAQASEEPHAPRPLAWVPPSPDSLWGGRNYDLVADAEAFMLNEFGPPSLVGDQPTPLETMLLNGPPCQPGRHSSMCWREFCQV